MSRHYNLETFLRQTPNGLLKEYFDHKGLLGHIDFAALKKTETAPVLDAITALPDADRQQIEIDFQDVFDLADKAGTGIIADEARLLGLEIEDQLEAMENHYHRAMWLLLNRTQAGEDMFHTCWLMAQMKTLTFTRAKRRNGLPDVAPKHDDATLKQMAEAVSHLYRRQGRGHECTVVYHLRPDPTRHCFFGFPEDYSTSELQYENGELKRRTRKSVFEICFVYRPAEGVLEVSAPGGKSEAEDLQEVFCRIALGLPRVPPPATKNAYELNGLKSPKMSFPTDPADQVAAVDVVAMRINEVGNRRRRLTFEQDPTASETLHDWIGRALNAEQVPWTMIDVNQARFRLTFRGEPNRGRKPTLTFTVTMPDSTSLKDGPRDQVAKRCLKKWKIAR